MRPGARRHSIAVGFSSSSGSGFGGGRRASVADSINNLTKTFSQGLALKRSSGSLGSSLEFETGEIFLHKSAIESALRDYYSDGELQVSRTKVKRCSSTNEVYKLELWMKGLSGKRKLSFLVQKFEETKTECLVYKTIVEDIRQFLASNPDINRKYLPVPDAFVCHNEGDNEDNSSDFFVLEDVRNLGYRQDILHPDRGLDYEHSIMGIATIAKFHASSYCYRRENSLDLKNISQLLGDQKLPEITGEFVEEIKRIIESSGFEKYSEHFLSAARGNILPTSNKLDKFGVLCHGAVTRNVILFKYKNQGDTKQTCQEGILTNLDSAHVGSCVMDLLQFLFTCVDQDVRQSFIADFICSVYYDNFAKTVASLSPGLAMFTKKEFIREVAVKMVWGFLVTAESLETTWRTEGAGKSVKNTLVATIRDIVQFKLNAEVTIK